MTINIPTPPLAFNAGGGCGDPNCDYQIQCEDCWIASRAQLAAFWARHGCQHAVMIGLYDESAMRQADHQEALGKL